MSFLNNSFISNSTGAAQAVQGQSGSAFVSSLLAGSAAAIVQLAIFALLKDRLPKL
jgi:hypothetical protein